MKKILIMAAVLLSSVAASAQHAVGSVTLQPKVGLNIASLTKSEGADPRFGLGAGLEFEYQATDIFSISAGAMYSMQGNKFSAGTSVFGQNLSGSVTTKLDYINVPIMANVYVVPGLAVKVGIQPGFLVSSKTKTEVFGQDLGKTEITAKDVDCSIPVGLSYEFSNVVLDARYNFGVTKTFDYSDKKNSVFQITLGYKFDL